MNRLRRAESIKSDAVAARDLPVTADLLTGAAGLTWSGSDLRLQVQSAEAALTAARMAVQAGSATSGDGAARVDMTLAGLK